MNNNIWWQDILSSQPIELSEGVIGNFIMDWIVSPLLWPVAKILEIMDNWQAINSSKKVLTITNAKRLQEAGFNTNIVCNSAARVYRAFNGFYKQNSPYKEYHVFAILSGEDAPTARLHIKCAMVAMGALTQVWLRESFKTLRTYVLMMFDNQAAILKKRISDKELESVRGTRDLITRFFNFPYLDIHNHPGTMDFIRNAPDEESKKLFCGLTFPSPPDLNGMEHAAAIDLHQWYLAGSYVMSEGGCTKYGDRKGELDKWEVYSSVLDETFYVEEDDQHRKILTIPPYALVFPAWTLLNSDNTRIIRVG